MSYEDNHLYQKAMESFVIKFSDGKGYCPATGQKFYDQPTIRNEIILRELKEVSQ